MSTWWTSKCMVQCKLDRLLKKLATERLRNLTPPRTWNHGLVMNPHEANLVVEKVVVACDMVAKKSIGCGGLLCSSRNVDRVSWRMERCVEGEALVIVAFVGVCRGGLAGDVDGNSGVDGDDGEVYMVDVVQCELDRLLKKLTTERLRNLTEDIEISYNKLNT
ncbi:hypothetical protein VN97_g2728 [Penicillium thymicola]|uniref:Uncharacterized protein n=1 Tax=Penicillium thymicola TaxID=293382 RepID=A0AAI9TNH8_PENTH|nr:hypothetical protein VN97_g2728 [Penicillium thymicola]